MNFAPMNSAPQASCYGRAEVASPSAPSILKTMALIHEQIGASLALVQQLQGRLYPILSQNNEKVVDTGAVGSESDFLMDSLGSLNNKLMTLNQQLARTTERILL